MTFSSTVKTIAIAIAALWGISAQAAPDNTRQQPEQTVVTVKNAADAFVAIPADVLELLTPHTRMIMVEHYNTDHRGGVAVNELEGVSDIDTLTNFYAKINLTDVSTIELRILPYKNADIVVMVYTIDSDNAPADSQIYIFDNHMQQLPTAKFFKTPSLKDFFSIPKGSSTKMKEITEMVPFPTVEYNLSQTDPTITGHLTIDQYLPVEDYNLIKLFVRPEVVWTWNGSQFKIKK